jgi:hypothetical protein
MEFNIKYLENVLCTSLCGEVSLHLRKDGRISISTPFRFPDGDALLMIAEPTPTGGVRLSDFGHTLMHLSYSMDVDDLMKPGNRNDLFNKILADHGVGFKRGAIYVETVVTEIGQAVFNLSQALSQVFDISFLSRTRVSYTFYEDLEKAIFDLAPRASIHKDYIVEDRKNAADYPIDYRIDFPGATEPLFLFGVPTNEKAKLATLIIQHWHSEEIAFVSFVVYQDQTKISRPDVARLSNVGDQSIASLDAISDMKRKLEHTYRLGSASPTGAI